MGAMGLSDERARREAERAAVREREERRCRRWLVHLPLAMLIFWSLAGTALIVSSAATSDPDLGLILFVAGPALFSTGLLVSFVFWLLSVTERDML